MEETVLGVIGGLGPLATAHFLELTTRMTDAKVEQQNLDMIVYNFPSIPDRTGYILGSNLKSPLPGLLWAGRSLAQQGVDVIAIPCVTAHFFYEELCEGVRTPIIHGVRETARHLKARGVSSAGIMATDGTILSGLFSRALSDEGIRPVLPSKARQADVMQIIYKDIKAGNPPDMTKFHAVEEELRKKGAETIVLGCTELSLVKKDFPLGPGYLDSMEVLAQQALLRCGKPIKQQYHNLITQEGENHDPKDSGVSGGNRPGSPGKDRIC